MTVKSRFFKLIPLALAISPFLSGCATIDVRGHGVDQDDMVKIEIGKTTKDKVRELLGTPSSVSPFGNKTWYYMSEVTQRRAFFAPTVISSHITRIEFDDKNIVKKVDYVTEKEKQTIAHVGRQEPTAGHSFGVLEQLFGNVGRFNGKDPDK